MPGPCGSTGFAPTLTHPAATAPGSPLSRIAGEGAERQRREAGEGSSPALPLPDKPSIAVLPFANMSGDPEQEYFADGMVEEIITALSRIRWLFDAAMRLMERSLSLNPSFAFGWLLSGFLKLWAGQSDLAIPDLETSLRLNPRDRRHFSLLGLASPTFSIGALMMPSKNSACL